MRLQCASEASIPYADAEPSTVVNKSPQASSQHQSKRVRLDSLAEVDAVRTGNGISDSDQTNEHPSALALPALSRSEHTDSDDDDAEVMASLVAASQALQRMPANDSVIYDSTLAFDEHGMEGDEEEEISEDEDRASSQTDEEEPPPDPYGMPPLSQWKRSSKR